MWDVDQYWDAIRKKFAYSLRQKPPLLPKLPDGLVNTDQEQDHSHYLIDLSLLLPKAGLGTGLEAYLPSIRLPLIQFRTLGNSLLEIY